MYQTLSCRRGKVTPNGAEVSLEIDVASAKEIERAITYLNQAYEDALAALKAIQETYK